MKYVGFLAGSALAVATVISASALASNATPAVAATARVAKPQARLSVAQARKVALNAYPGKILSEELEHEKGGSGLRYSFDIRHGKVIHEVGVDAVTGKVLENDVDKGND